MWPFVYEDASWLSVAGHDEHGGHVGDGCEHCPGLVEGHGHAGGGERVGCHAVVGDDGCREYFRLDGLAGEGGDSVAHASAVGEVVIIEIGRAHV